ncbi:TPA: ATP-binding protein, partial [Streptococcus pyogenes]|nr:ATP-binding protein [Streptococcus pyogenes]
MRITNEMVQQKLAELQFKEVSVSLSEFIHTSEKEQDSYQAFLYRILSFEAKRREDNKVLKRLKLASFPYQKTLEDFRIEEQQSLSSKQLNQLRELTWLEQAYNLILLGPPGVGKTHLA